MKIFIQNILFALDCLFSAVIGLDPQETISSVLGKLNSKRKPVGFIVFIVDSVFWVLTQELDHCHNSIMPNEGLFTNNYNGAISPSKVVRYSIPLQIIGVIVLFNMDFVLQLLASIA